MCLFAEYKDIQNRINLNADKPKHRTVHIEFENTRVFAEKTLVCSMYKPTHTHICVQRKIVFFLNYSEF